MIPGVNYVIMVAPLREQLQEYHYSVAYITLEENIIGIITQDRVIDDRKGKLKTKVCVVVDYSD